MRPSIWCVALVIMLSACGGGGGGGDKSASTPQEPVIPEMPETGGCNGMAYEAGMRQLTLTFGGLDRTYELHLPNSYDGMNQMPLVLAFHGGGGQSGSQRRLSHFETLGEQRGFITVYPDGVERSWNASPDDTDYAGENNIDDVGFVDALITALVTNYCINPGRVYATGMSNGARLTQRLGCELANKIAAIAPVSGAMPTAIAPTCVPARPLSVIELHGTADPLSPYEGGATDTGNPVLSFADTIAGWVARDGCVGAPQHSTIAAAAGEIDGDVEVDTYENCSSGVSVASYSIGNGGHTWPQGEQYLPESIIGHTSQAFNATETIWSFFADKQLN